MNTPNEANASPRLDPPSTRASPHFILPANGVRLLLEAYDCARELETDGWEFAVEVRRLEAAGLTNTHLRWLLFQGYAAQGVEQSRPKDRRRAFRRIANLSLSEAACFVLTKAGAVYALACCGDAAVQVAASDAKDRPTWDEGRRELRVGQTVVKRFKQPAANQERVLAAFQEEGWRPRIDDPLPPQPEQDAKRRLHSTISNLNRGHEKEIIRFEGGGDGESVSWRLLGPVRSSEHTARTQRV